MSRHRNVRNYAYEDDMSDDVYGHSVEDHDMCVSPSTAHQFMYNRNNEDHKRNVFGHYMDTRFGSVEEQVEEEEQSEEEDLLSHSQDYRRPQLDPISQAKLSSCLDQLQSILGDDCHEPTAVEAIIKFDFDAEKALDYIFEKGNNKASSKQTKKSDSISCQNMSRKSAPSVTMLNSLSSEHTTPTQLHSNKNTDTLSSLTSEPLNAIVEKDKPTKDSFPFSNFQNVSNNNSSLMGLSLKSLSEQGESSKRQHHSMTEGELMASSLSSLTNSSVNEFSGITKPTSCRLTESDLMSTSLSSLANQGGKKGVTKWPDKNENTTESALFTTSLSSLANQNFYGNVLGLQDTSKNNNFAETSLMSAPLSSLASDSHLPKSGISPFDVVTATSLSSLARQSDLTLLPLNLPDNSKPEEKFPLGTSLSSLANESNLGTFSENSSSASGQDLNHGFLETSLSALSLSSLTYKKDVEKPSMSSIGLESIVFKEPTNDGLQITAHKETKQRKRLDSAKKSLMLSKETTAGKAKKHRTRTKQNPLLRVKPSMFAFTICYSAKRRCDVPVKRLNSINRYFGLGNIFPFDFKTPSPDDVIQRKQKKGFSR